MQEFASIMPDWIGTVPAWGMFFLMLIAIIKTYPLVQKNLLDARETREGRYSKRISELEEAVRRCQEECEAHKQEMRVQIEGMRSQHMSEQLALVRTIVDIFPESPKLALLLRALERGERSVAHQLTGVVGDAAKPSE